MIQLLENKPHGYWNSGQRAHIKRHCSVVKETPIKRKCSDNLNNLFKPSSYKKTSAMKQSFWRPVIKEIKINQPLLERFKRAV